MASSRAAASAPLLLAALSRAEAAAGELTTRGASALSALRSAVAAAAGAALSAKASNNNANAAANAGAAAAASASPSLTEEEVQAVWDAALKLWVRIQFWKRDREGASERGGASSPLSSSPSLLLSLFFSSPSQQNPTEHLRRRLQQPAAPGVARGREAARMVR